ncbi:MAG TPA: STAS domain-containing protein [Acidobacteriota bacterium]|nr:STAS domain-containing protein [Acidobacteriota bacterium]
MRTTQADGIRISLATAGTDGGLHVVRLDGRVDTLTAGELDDVIGTLIGRGCTRLIIDLAGVGYISSAGWGIFVSRLREARDGGGDIKLTRMSAPVQDVYDLLEFDGLLPRYAYLEDAQAAYEGKPARRPTDTTEPDERPQAPVISVAAVEPAGPALNLEDAVLRLVLEDPFYRINDMKRRLIELRHDDAGWWAIWRVLRQRRLLRLRQRFAYFRRHRSAAPSSW